jgi:hypothetical protein
MKNLTLPESICFWTFVLTWPLYLVGALYLVGPILAWTLLFLIIISAYLGSAIRADLTLTNHPPHIVWAWIVGMFVLLVALIIGHLNWDLDTGQIIKSSVGWAKGWALIAIFILIGSMLKIRREVLIRSQNIVGLCTVFLFPLMFIAPSIGLPAKLFVSPLAATGGPGPEYFSIYLYTLDPETMTPRWQFYAPWSPFAGLLGVTMALFAIEDRKRFWLVCGLLGGVIMIYFSKSRMSLVSLAVCIIVPRLLPYLKQPRAWVGLTIGMSSLEVFGESVLGAISNAIEGFRTARVSSSRVRDTIQSIGYYRWKTEAIWFGHGTVVRGPHIVEYMPIGSHHTWYALLFVKGLVGFLTFLILMVWHLFLVLKDAILSSRGRLPLAMMLNLVILTFGENIEIEVYLLWPAFVLLGIHANELNQTETVPFV